MGHNTVHPETVGSPGGTAILVESLFKRLVADELRVGGSGFTGRVRNIGLLLRASLVGIVECATCFCCCFGCMGNGRAHSGMVKYDDDDDDEEGNSNSNSNSNSKRMYAAMPADAKRATRINEHVSSCMLCSPVSCCTLMCCFGCCGSCGPVGTSMALMGALPN